MKQFFTLVFAVACTIVTSSGYSENTDPHKLANNQNSADIKMLSSTLFTPAGNIVDGNRVVFDPQYSNAVDGNDAIKMLNPGENFGLSRDHYTLAVEARQPVAAGDTLFYNFTNLVSQVYLLEIAAQHLGNTIENCELIDQYLHTRKRISLTDSNHLRFEITADPASHAANRLLIVFSNQVDLSPVKFTTLTALRNERTISLKWQVEHELNVQLYEIERGNDAEHLAKISSAAPLYENESGGMYQYSDIITPETDQYYRIKSISKSGTITYSKPVKVNGLPGLPQLMAAYPNPVRQNSFQVAINNMLPGRYYIKLTSCSGQSFYQIPVTISGNHFVQDIRPDEKLVPGVYSLSLWSANTIVQTQKLIVQ